MKKIGIIIVIIFLALLAFSQKLEGYIFKRESIGRVLVVDNSNAIVQGVSKVGSQALTVEVLTGKNKGKGFLFDRKSCLAGAFGKHR